MSYGLKGNFHRRAELSSNLGEVKLGKERERGGSFYFVLLLFKGLFGGCTKTVY